MSEDQSNKNRMSVKQLAVKFQSMIKTTIPQQQQPPPQRKREVFTRSSLSREETNKIQQLVCEIRQEIKQEQQIAQLLIQYKDQIKTQLIQTNQSDNLINQLQFQQPSQISQSLNLILEQDNYQPKSSKFQNNKFRFEKEELKNQIQKLKARIQRYENDEKQYRIQYQLIFTCILKLENKNQNKIQNQNNQNIYYYNKRLAEQEFRKKQQVILDELQKSIESITQENSSRDSKIQDPQENLVILSEQIKEKRIKNKGSLESEQKEISDIAKRIKLIVHKYQVKLQELQKINAQQFSQIQKTQRVK